MKMRKLRLLLVLASVAAIPMAVVGCGRRSVQNGEKKAVEVRAITIESGSETSSLHYVATIEEESKTSLSFATGGTVEKIAAEEGAYVNKGAVLARLDARSLKQQRDFAKATLEQAEDAHKRLKFMYENETIPEIKYIEAKTRLSQARAAYDIAEKNLSDAEAKAPISGIIGKKSVETGENVLPSQPILTILNIAKVVANISVPEKELALIQKGTKAEVELPMLGGAGFTGVVTEKGVEGNASTHTYKVKISLDNPEKKIMPGMLCEVEIHAGEQPVVSVPNNCVQITSSGERYVWVVRTGLAVRVPVTAGDLTPEGVIIESGLFAGDRVIVQGMSQVSENQEVIVL